MVGDDADDAPLFIDHWDMTPIVGENRQSR